MDKFVKLSAIEQMAKPMAAFHKGEKPEMEMEESEDMCVCPKCGHEYEHSSESEDYEDED
jgi:hypothetical protein